MSGNKIGLALSGGGSRAIAFHYGVLEAFHNLNISPKIDVVSGISGGAIVAALWVLHATDWQAFSKKLERLLEVGIERPLLAHITNLNWVKNFCGIGINPECMAEVLDRTLYGGIKLRDIPETPELILNATELTNGINFKFSKKASGSYKDGEVGMEELRLSQAVAYSAAYPLFFSVKKLPIASNKNVFLTDGGAYDCLGANALMPDKNEESILTQNCETLIVSDASFPYNFDPQSSCFSVANGLYGSYLASSNKNRSLIYNKLFLLNKSGKIPYLGTIKMDSTHPDLTKGWNKDELKFINKFPTHFRPIEGKALTTLKERGRKTAEFITKEYLPHLT